jgi:hypothetical protein
LSARPSGGDKGSGQRTLGLSIFFLVAAIGAVVVWWMAVHSPFSLTNMFKHFDGIEEAIDSISIGFLAIAVVCFGIGAILLLVSMIQMRRRRTSQ